MGFIIFIVVLGLIVWRIVHKINTGHDAAISKHNADRAEYLASLTPEQRKYYSTLDTQFYSRPLVDLDERLRKLENEKPKGQ